MALDVTGPNEVLQKFYQTKRLQLKTEQENRDIRRHLDEYNTFASGR